MKFVDMVVPRVVAELLGISCPQPRCRSTEVTPVVHPTNSLVIRQRTEAVRILADSIQSHPSAWGVWADADERHRLASRLLELRNRVRACAIEEAVEVAAL